MGRVESVVAGIPLGDAADLRARMDELAALVPDLPPWSGNGSDARTAPPSST